MRDDREREKYYLRKETQPGYCKVYSKYKVTIRLKYNIPKVIDKGKITFIVMVGYSNPFGTTNYVIFSTKIHLLKSSKQPLHLMISYLYN